MLMFYFLQQELSQRLCWFRQSASLSFSVFFCISRLLFRSKLQFDLIMSQLLINASAHFLDQQKNQNRFREVIFKNGLKHFPALNTLILFIYFIHSFD